MDSKTSLEKQKEYPWAAAYGVSSSAPLAQTSRLDARITRLDSKSSLEWQGEFGMTEGVWNDEKMDSRLLGNEKN